MAKFVVVSDIHLNLWNFGDSIKRLENNIDCLHWSIEKAIENNCDAILFCGDIFHTHGNISTIVLSKLYDCLSINKLWLQEHAVYIPGNHDLVYKNNTMINSIKFLDYFGSVINWNHSVDLPNMPLIYGIPYIEDSDCLQRLLETAPRDSIIIMHQGVSGVEVNNKGFTLNEILTPDMIPSHILHAFTGHYHTRKIINSKLTIPGALVQHNFSDAGEVRGSLLVETDSDGLKFTLLPSPCYIFYRISYEQFLKQDIGSDNYFSIEDVPFNCANEVDKIMREYNVCYRILTTRTNQPVIKTSCTNSIDVNLDLFSKAKNLNDLTVKIGKEIISCN